MTAPDPRLGEIAARLTADVAAYNDHGFIGDNQCMTDRDYLITELRKRDEVIAGVTDVLDNWQAEVPFQDAEETQRWYSLGKRHAAERIRFELADSRAAVTAAKGDGVRRTCDCVNAPEGAPDCRYCDYKKGDGE